MRQFSDSERLFGNELTSIATDAPTGTAVIEGTAVSQAAAFEIDVASGTIALDGTVQDVTAEASIAITAPAADGYRYDVVTRDGTGAVTVTDGLEGTIDSGDVVDAVASPDRPDGHVLLATLRVLDDGIDHVFDGRAVDTRQGVPSGVITMWSGSVADIPDGWTLCDGSNGTPDLTDRFVKGAGGSESPGDTGGESEVQLSESEIPSHDHDDGSLSTGFQSSHTHGSGDLEAGSDTGTISLDEGTGTERNPIAYFAGALEVTGSTSSAGGHSHSVSGTTSDSGGDEAHENEPPYHALAYIMKV